MFDVSGAFPVAYAVALVAIIAVTAVGHVRNKRMFKGSESWPQSEATVEFVSVRRAGRRGSPRFIGELAYSYFVQGSYYSGFCRRQFPTEKVAQEFVETFRGKTLPVRYKPDAPETSVM